MPDSSGSRNGTCTFCGIVYKGGKTNRMLVHLARACGKISAEVKRERLCHVFLLLKSYPTGQLLQNVVSVNPTPALFLIAELLVVYNHSYREDRAMMNFIQMITEKWKTLLEFYKGRMESGH